MESSKKLKFIIIGAGCAGLEAAKTLHTSGYEFTILEASDYIGGRVKDLENFAEFDLDLGGEFVHGEKTPHYEYAKKFGKFSNQGGYHYTTLNGKLIKKSKLPFDVTRLDYKANKFDYVKSEETDMTYEEGYKKNKAEEQIIQFHAPNLKSYYGTDIDKISIFYSKKMDNALHEQAGDWNCRLMGMSNGKILKKAYEEIWDKVQLNTVVKKVDISKEECEVTDSQGNIYKCDKVICTIPLTILKEGSIQFIPELSPELKEAIDKIGMGPMGKLFLKFKKEVWPSDISFCGFPGIFDFAWVPTSNYISSKSFVLTFHVIGRSAEAASKMTKKEIEDTVLGELAKLLGGNVHKEFLDSYYMDWTKSEFIKGGYSYPTIGEGGMRKVFEKPYLNKLRFAGEAYRDMGTTIGTAMMSGREAVMDFIGTGQMRAEKDSKK